MSDELEKNRIITICTEIEPLMADIVMKEMLLLDRHSHKPITLYINSPGGEVVSGLQIIDTMNFIASPVNTVCTGSCASMAAVILSNGETRSALEHARVMIHQVSSGTQGKVFDMKAAYNEAERLNQLTLGILAENCGKTLDNVLRDTSVDKWLDANAAKSYGIIDTVIASRGRKKAHTRKDGDETI